MISFAIIGWGHIAKKHRQAIEAVEGANLIAVCDSNPERLAELQDEVGISCYTSLEDMLQDERDIDVLCICTPSGLHARHAITAAKAGKHLIIEKPIALTTQDAQEVVRVAELNRVKVTVVHPNRFRPAIQKLKAAISEQRFGKISHLSATIRWNRGQQYYDQAAWRGTLGMDGGVLLNQAIHNLDLLLWLAGPVVEVKSLVDTRIRSMEAEDIAIATLRFASGALGTVEATTAIYEKNLEETIAVFGEYGYAIIGGPTANLIKHWSFLSYDSDETETLIDEIKRDPYGQSGHQVIVQDMVESIKNNRNPAIPAIDGLMAVKLANEIYQDGIVKINRHALEGIV